MIVHEKVSLQDIDIITTISESEKSSVSLVSIKGEQDLAIMKRHPGMDMLERYRRIVRLNSEYFPKVYRLWEENGETILLEEYLAGKTLQERLEEAIPLREDEITGYMLEVCRALHVLHNADVPIIHRDIKPENILITTDGKVKLIDFDASRQYKEDKERDTVALGTKEYASPEQYGFMQTDIRSDIYSWGIVFAELLEHAEVEEVYRRKARRVIDRATMFDPVKRYPNTEQLLRDLQLLKKRKNILLQRSVTILSALLVVGMIAFAWKTNYGSVDDGKVNGEEKQAQALQEQTSQEDMGKQEQSVVPEGLAESVVAPVIEPVEADSLEEAYSYISIETELKAKDEAIMETRPDLYNFLLYEDNDSGVYSDKQENIIGSEHSTLRFLKAQPRDIVICDQTLEGMEVGSIYYYPYLEELGLNGHRVDVDDDSYSRQYGNMISFSSDFLQTLPPGAYTFKMDMKGKEEDVLYGFYLVVHGEDEEITNFRVEMLDSIGYYSSESKNDVLFYINNTPFPIQEIKAGNKVLEGGDYKLVDRGFGVVFPAEFLEQYEQLEGLELLFTMQNGKQMMSRIIYLQHF